MKLPIRPLIPAACAAALLLAATPSLSAAVVAPGDVSGLTLFLDSGTGLTYDGSNKVSQWNDQATDGPYNAVQTTGTLQPTYSATGGGGGSSTLTFNGLGSTNQTQGGYLNAAGAQASVTTSLTMFVVFSINNVDTSMALVDASSTNSNLRGFTVYNHSTGGLTVAFKDAAYVNTGQTAPNNLTLFSTSLGKVNTPLNEFVVAVAQVQSNGTTMIRLGDVSATTTRNLTLTDISGYTNFLRVGANTAGTWRLGGSISSVALYDRALTTQEMDDVYNFMYDTYVANVPEPQTIFLLGTAAAGFLVWRKRRV